MSAVDRPALAAALRVATPEMLREAAHIAATQADDVERLWTLSPNDAPELQAARKARAEAFRRLAALALAVSEAMAFDSRVEQAYGRDFLILDIGLPDAHGLGYGGCDLPAALSALVEGAA